MRTRQQILGLVLGVLSLFAGLVEAEDRHLPFVLASKAATDVTSVTAEVKSKLQAVGFEIAGFYSPYENATIIVVTNDALKQAAAKSERGGFGAAQRVSITKVGDEVQVAYTNPVYMAAAYRMQADLAGIASQLAEALGRVQDYGSKKGLTAEQLRKYHYLFGMEYFDEPSELAKYAGYAEAVQAVEAGLASGKGGVSKVYRIDIPGKQETVFGVAMDNSVECSGDEHIMQAIDFKPLRSTAHLPYEMLVSGNGVYALYARFRIAINFPDLSMMGAHSFMNIMCAPPAIEKALKLAAGAREESTAAGED